MSASKRVVLAVIVAWLNKAITILANLFLMPILFRFLGREELGLWFLLGNSQAFLALLGFGIAPVLSRNIALSKGKSGSDPDVKLSTESRQEIADLIVTGKIILRWLAVFVFIVSYTSGFNLINRIELNEISSQELYLAWFLMCLGYSVGVWVDYLNCWLSGLGYIGWNSLISTVTFITTIAGNIIVVLLGGGLLGLALVTVASNILNRLLIIIFVRRKKIETTVSHGSFNLKYARNMIKPALSFWITSLGMFLILKTDQYFITLVSGAENIPAYNAAYQLASNLRNIAIPFALSASSFISQMWQSQNLIEARKLVNKSCRFGLSIMCIGSGYLVVIGQDLTDLWLGDGIFAGSLVLIVFCIMFIFEVQNVCLMYGARATGYEKFILPSLGAGLLNILFTTSLIKPFGLVGVAIGTLIGQCLTSNWYIVLKSLTILEISYSQYFIYVFLPSIIFFLLSIFIAFVTGELISLYSEDILILLLSTTITCGLFFVIIFWLWVLENSQRDDFVSRLKNMLTI